MAGGGAHGKIGWYRSRYYSRGLGSLWGYSTFYYDMNRGKNDTTETAATGTETRGATNEFITDISTRTGGSGTMTDIGKGKERLGHPGPRLGHNNRDRN